MMCSKSLQLSLSELSRVVTTMGLEFRYVKVVGNWPLNLGFKKICVLLQSQINLAPNFDTGQTCTMCSFMFSCSPLQNSQ